MPIIDRAANVLDLLDANGIGDRPVIFVVHSMGGLVVKQLLRTSWDADISSPISKVAKRTRGIVFFATPNTGSGLANYLDSLRFLLLPSRSVLDLKRNEPYLRDLNTWFRNNVRAMGLKLKVYSETQKTRGVLVVDQVSSDPGIEGVMVVPFDSNHEGICKIDGEYDSRFKQTLRLIRECLAQDGPITPGSASSPLDKVTVDVGVNDKPMRSSPHMESHQENCILHYVAKRTTDGRSGSAIIEVSPKMGYLNQLETGGPVPQLNYFYNPFLCQFPNLDLTVVNNSSETVVITEALFEIDQSRPDNSPVIVFDDKNYQMKLNINNEGWGEIANGLLRFNLLPTGLPFQIDPPIDHLPNCPPYHHVLPIGNFASHIEVDIKEVLSGMGVDVQAIENAQYYPRLAAALNARMHGIDPELAQRFACFPANVDPEKYRPFADGYAVLVGVIEFDFLNQYGVVEHRAIKFSAKVFLFMPPLMAPMPPSAQFNVMFDVGASDYQVSCLILHRLMPGEPDRFNIRIGAEMSASHAFKIRLVFNGGRSIVSAPIHLHHFVPRTWASMNSDLRSIDETALEETVNYPSSLPYPGCVAAGFEVMENLLLTRNRSRPNEESS